MILRPLWLKSSSALKPLSLIKIKPWPLSWTQCKFTLDYFVYEYPVVWFDSWIFASNNFILYLERRFGIPSNLIPKNNYSRPAPCCLQKGRSINHEVWHLYIYLYATKLYSSYFICKIEHKYFHVVFFLKCNFLF